MKHKLTALLTCGALLLTMTACRGSKKGATLDIDLTTAWLSEQVAKDGITLAPCFSVANGIVMDIMHTRTELWYYLYNPEDDSITKLDKHQKGAGAWAGTLPDGRLGILYNVSLGRRSGQDIYDGKQRVLEIYNSDGSFAEEVALPDTVPEQELRSNTITADSEGRWYLFTTDKETGAFASLYVLNPDFSVKGQIPLDFTYSNEIAAGRSGKVYAMMSSGSDNAYQLCRFDADTMTSERFESAIPIRAMGIASGTGDYELYYFDDMAVYGIRDDLSPEIVVDLRNTGFPEGIIDCFPLPDGTFVLYHNSNDHGLKTHRIRPRTPEETAHTRFVSLAGVNLREDLIRNICDYNREHTDLLIVIKDYADPYRRNQDLYADSDWVWTERQAGNWQATLDAPAARYPEALEDFKRDLLDGIVPDIICMDSLPYQQLSNKGLLADLAPMMAEDERFNPDDYFMNIFDGLKRGDKLERIGFSFTISTVFGKTELVGAEQGLTPDAYIRMIENRPENMELFAYTTRENITANYLTGSQSSFIDRGTMTCSFDSPAFIGLLKLAEAASPENQITYSDEELQEQLDLGYAYWEKHRLLFAISLRNPVSYHAIHQQDFHGDDITLVGYPDAAGGNGGRYRMNYVLSLTAQSARQEEAWDYCLWELSSIRQSKVGLDSNSDMNSLPVLWKMYDYYLDAATRGYHYEGNATTAEMDDLRDYAAGMRMYEENDPFITQIICEEADKYFAGDQTAEQAAAAIQSRASLYLSEAA